MHLLKPRYGVFLLHYIFQWFNARNQIDKQYFSLDIQAYNKNRKDVMPLNMTVISNNSKPYGFVIAAGKNRFRVADIHFRTLGYIQKIGDMFQYKYTNGVRFRSDIYDPLFLFDDETTPKGE